MDFHAAMETFAEAWVAANTPTAVNSADSLPQPGKQSNDDLPTLLTKEQLASKQSPPSSSPRNSSPVQSHTPGHAHPTTGHAQPTTGHAHPTTGHTQSTTGHTHSTTGHTHSTTGHTHPATGHTHSTTGHTHSTTGHTHPATGHTHSTTGHTHLTTGHTHPATGHTHSPTAPTYQKADHTPPVPNPASTALTSAGTKSLPVHCVIEQTTGSLTFDGPECGSDSSVELDSYAILPGTTLFGEVVRAALVKLGYNATEAITAKGAVQIKNWRPLTFDVITEDDKATLEDIWGELTQVATLRIRLSSSAGFSVPDTWTDNAVRCAVLSLLKETSQSTLAKSCPLTQSTISNIANWKYGNKLSLEKCREFGEWYKHKATIVKDFPCEKSIPKDTRLTFHPEHEVPQMRKWYKSCKNPTDSKLKFFTGELNKGHVRQERPKVTVAKVKIWWKNERQREKRMNQKKLPTTTEESDETSQESLQHSSDIEKTRSLLSNDLDKTRSLLLCELEKSSSLLGFETSENVSHLMYGTVGEDLSEDVSHISASHTVTMAGDSHSSGKVSVSHDVASHTAAMQSVHRRLQQESHDLSQSHGLAEDTGWPQNT